VALNAYWAALIVAAMCSRAAIVVVMHALPHARDHGLSRSVGRPSLATTAMAAAITGVAVLVIAPGWLPAVLIVSALATLACAAIAKVKIGGQTGDVLGAVQQLTEVAVLITTVTVLT
jgi:adenosylcobinamide-GDP ribazoletransferase